MTLTSLLTKTVYINGLFARATRDANIRKSITYSPRRLLHQKKNELDTNHGKPKRTKFQSIIALTRLDKPIGTILALCPSLWAMEMATTSSSTMPSPSTVAIFIAGAITARGMGCTWNDLLDRKYDRLVERTKDRPIANGDISVKEALAYLAIQSMAGLGILCLNNATVIKLGFVSVLMMTAYPLFKRFTNWPQLMLAFTINWGALMGWAAVKGTIAFNDVSTLFPIYLGSILWTLYYDTIYAHQDKTDDLFVGVKSTALRLGSNTKPFLYAMSSGMFSSLATAGCMTEQLYPFYLCSAASYLYQIHQIKSLDLNDASQCWNAFDSQKYVGIFLCTSILLGILAKHRGEIKKFGNQDDNK